MLKSEPLSAVRCPSCDSSLKGGFGDASVSIDEGEMNVSVYCEGCDGRVDFTIGPIPPDGRKVDVTLEGRRL